MTTDGAGSDRGIQEQHEAHEAKYGLSARERWSFHQTDDPLVRFLRDRRLRVAMHSLEQQGLLQPGSDSVLVTCGGVGGEGTFLANFGYRDVTVSDFSDAALKTCRELDPRLKTLHLNAEALALPDRSFDVVLVQDGLHHLPRPVLGFTEMLRVARKAVVVIEPHFGVVGAHLGREWEIEGDAVNYVFRWTGSLVEQVTRSYLLDDSVVGIHRFWDHNLAVGGAVSRLPRRYRLRAAKMLYGGLRAAGPLGNMMVAVVGKGQNPARERLLGH